VIRRRNVVEQDWDRATIFVFNTRKCELAWHYKQAHAHNRSPHNSKWKERASTTRQCIQGRAQHPAGLTRWARARGAVDGLTVEAAAGMHAVEDSRGGTVAARTVLNLVKL